MRKAGSGGVCRFKKVGFEFGFELGYGFGVADFGGLPRRNITISA